MVSESWITPEETPALAAAARAVIDDRLQRLSEAGRAAFWLSIRKCYNTPYNDPVRRAPKSLIGIEPAPALPPAASVPPTIAADTYPDVHAA